MAEPSTDKLSRWDPRDDEAWQQRLAADASAAERLQTTEMREITAAVLERALAGGASAVALTGSTVRSRRTAISDLDFHVVGERPPTDDLPADVDVYAGDEAHLLGKLRSGDDFVQWTLRFGCVLADSGVLRAAGIEVVAQDLWPDGAAKLARLPEHRRLAERLLSVGDREAAQDQVRATLTSAARGLLLAAGAFPLARSELPGQLRLVGANPLAEPLDLVIHGNPSLHDLRRGLGALDAAVPRAVALGT